MATCDCVCPGSSRMEVIGLMFDEEFSQSSVYCYSSMCSHMDHKETYGLLYLREWHHQGCEIHHHHQNHVENICGNLQVLKNLLTLPLSSQGFTASQNPLHLDLGM